VSEPIRILLADLPRTVEEIISQSVSTQPDMEVVGTVDPGESVVTAARRTRAQLVVVGDRDEEAEERLERLVLREPDVRFLALSADARRATVYEVRPHRVPLGELSPGQLPDAVRSAVIGKVDRP